MKLSKNWGRLVMKSKLETKSLKELCSLIIDCPHSTPKWTSNGKIVVRNNNIRNGKIDLSSPSYTNEENFKQRIKRAIPQSGDIIITREAPMGEVGMIPDGVECCLGQRMVLLRANLNICDNYFLLYSLQSRFVQHQISWSEGTGTTVSNLRIPHLEQLKIPYINISTQKKIASILSALDDKIEVNQKINENLEQQAQAIFKNLLDNLNDYDIVSLDDMAIICNKTFNPSKEKETMLEHYSIPSYDDSKFPMFELSTNIKSNKFIIDKNCFLISKLNPTTKRVWKPYCISNKSVCSTEFIVYKAKNVIFTDYLYSLIDSDIFSEFMCSHVTGSTGSRQRTTPSETLKFKFKIPKTDDLLKFNSIVSPIYKQIMNNAIQNDRLKQIRDTLLPKLINGEINVNGN